MVGRIESESGPITFDLKNPEDISIPFGSNSGPLAWYVEHSRIEPVQSEGFIGLVKEGGSVNFKDIKFNPHGNCTHTECVGHISPNEEILWHEYLGGFHLAQLVSLKPIEKNGDLILTNEGMGHLRPGIEAIVIRTLPNHSEKQQLNYSNTNPPYIDVSLMNSLNKHGIKHLLIDLPSVDREEDGGALAAHKAFWNYPKSTKSGKTITELIYVPDNVKDGLYVMQIQFLRLNNDASPSRPLLFSIIKT
ncbi:MAG: cyclase family protein [Flavobacteriales bacterium]|nr:cyclase family protein [Flavobacteriales bacterium]